MMPHFMATAARLSHVYPLGSRLDEDGVLEVGGCNALALAEEALALNPLPANFPNDSERVTAMFYYNQEIPKH